MLKQSVYMALLVGLMISAAAIGNGGSFDRILNGTAADGFPSKGPDRGLEVLTNAP